MNHILSARTYCSNTSTIKKSAKLIRNEFLDYFKNDLGHTFIRSSPVVPINDHTVPFVNAGMNQFKGIFLDYYDPPVMKAVNSQKCIRISGKHNDLNVVGSDTYHHTFFEMLGNWSFGEYFKKEACQYAWDLLTKGYNINKDFLYVTYFGGDEKLELEPDLECRDIWLNIGVPKDRILPFGIQENFWEMGISGPCGPCTEIHIDYTKQLLNQSNQISKNSPALTELWNIVFIQYSRLTDGTIVPLPKHHVDTGMGFERLVALLQGKKSNYDTDLFQPLFKTIQEYTKAPAYEGKFSNDKSGLDNGYRVLADHSRMISVALADGIIPEQSNKLRKIIRKVVDIGEKTFKKRDILPELAYAVAENLGDVYPELQNNLKTVQKIMRFEEELYIRLQNTSGKEWKKIVAKRPELASISEWATPGLVPGYKYFQSILDELKATNTLTGNVAFILYDTYGLSAETINELAEVESLRFDSAAFENEFENLKNRSRIGLRKTNVDLLRRHVETFKNNHVPKTDDSFKYKYIDDGNNYQFPTVDSKIVALIGNDKTISTEENESTELNEDEIGIVLDKTVCYSMEGGQVSDKGFICIKDLKFSINHLRKIDGYAIHFGTFGQNSSEEACCGTHVSKTGMLEYFCFLKYFTRGTCNFNLEAAVGQPAISAKLIGENIQSEVSDLEHELKTGQVSYAIFKLKSKQIENKLTAEAEPIPFLVKEDCLMKLKHLNDLAWTQEKEIEKSSINVDLSNIYSTFPFIVHCIRKKLLYLSLEEVVSLYPSTPILIIVYHDDTIKAWCSVPQEIASKQFNAKNWMNVVLKTFNVKYHPTTGFNPSLVASMKTMNISDASQKDLIQKAIEKAKMFAFAHVKYAQKSVSESKL
nr:PREDICTED: alanine--tRNA ligase, mitochondrial isoform X3 [Megachile rotundata]